MSKVLSALLFVLFAASVSRMPLAVDEIKFIQNETKHKME